MKRNYDKEDEKSSKKSYKGKNKSKNAKGNSKDKSKGGKPTEERDDSRFKDHPGLIPTKNGDKNPNWYFTDAAMADQVTQLSFQNLAGLPIKLEGSDLDVPNVMAVYLNPSPGVIKSADYGSTLLAKTSGINLAGFRLFSELAAYTGRTAVYGPQDISTMILAMGEVLSVMEAIRRAFGVAFTMNMRNRSYPRTVLEAGMRIDSTDFFDHFSDYRTRYNTLVTLVNQLPIPASVAYFDKCQSIYEEIYLDNDSTMAQTLVPMPWSTWVLDETSYSGGTILKTIPYSCDPSMIYVNSVQPMSFYLNIADTLIGALLNSSTLNVVYTDLLNLAIKKNVTFLKLDYLAEGYSVVPRFSQEFMLQMHNCTITNVPIASTFFTSPVHATPYNDVYPDPNINALFYNPGFAPVMSSPLVTATGSEVIVDTFKDSLDVTDRVEILRYASIIGTTAFTDGTQPLTCDATLPDHYVVAVYPWTPSGDPVTDLIRGVRLANVYPQWDRIATLAAAIDWAPRFVQIDSATGALTGNYTGDTNFYTTVGEDWLRKVNQFIALALYSIR